MRYALCALRILLDTLPGGYQQSCTSLEIGCDNYLGHRNNGDGTDNLEVSWWDQELPTRWWPNFALFPCDQVMIPVTP